jgi:hypothetical protein
VGLSHFSRGETPFQRQLGGVAVLKQCRAGKSTAISARFLQRAAQHTCVGIQLTLLRSIYASSSSCGASCSLGPWDLLRESAAAPDVDFKLTEAALDLTYDSTEAPSMASLLLGLAFAK